MGGLVAETAFVVVLAFFICALSFYVFIRRDAVETLNALPLKGGEAGYW